MKSKPCDGRCWGHDAIYGLYAKNLEEIKVAKRMELILIWEEFS